MKNLNLELRLTIVHSLLKKLAQGDVKSDIYKGRAGIALFFHYYGKSFEHGPSTNLARKLIRGCIEESLLEKCDLSLYAGVPGILWAAKKILGSDKEVNALLPRGYRQKLLLTMAEHMRYAGLYELAHGASGWWIYSESVPGSDWFREVVLEYLQKTRTIEATQWWSTSGEMGMGIAHGIFPPILLRNSKADAKRMKKFLKPWKESPLPSLYPKNIGKASVQSAWCYGDAGAGLSLTRLSLSLEDHGLLTIGKKIFRRGIVPKPFYAPIENPCICHGYSGQALMALRFWKLTGDPADKEAIHLWSDKLASMPEKDFRKMKKVGLHDGLAGIGLVFMALLDEKPEAWDRLLMLS